MQICAWIFPGWLLNGIVCMTQRRVQSKWVEYCVVYTHSREAATLAEVCHKEDGMECCDQRSIGLRTTAAAAWEPLGY